MNNICFLTHVDLDAAGAVSLVKYLNLPFDLFLQDYSDYKNNTFPYEQLKPYEKIFITDFYPDEKLCKQIEDLNQEVIILDHHESQKKELDEWQYNKKTYIYDDKRSGAKLYFDYLEEHGYQFNICIREFIDLVSCYDLWDLENPLRKKAEQLNTLFYKTLTYSKTGYDKYKYFIECTLKKFNEEEHYNFSSLEFYRIQEAKDREDAIFKAFTSGKEKILTRQDERGKYFCIIYLKSKVSAIANRLLEHYSKLDYIIIFNFFEPENPRISLRSKALNLLELEGVNGHENAAGVGKVSVEFIDNLWNGIVYSIPYKKS